MAKVGIPRTRYERARAWATWTLVICGAFSIWANIYSGQLRAESVIVSVMPPVVAFFTSHLIGYFNPRSTPKKIMVYGGFGTIVLFAMIGSGSHIVDTVVRTGQHVGIGVIYVFIVDAPMLLAGLILIDKVPVTKTVTKADKVVAKQPQTASTTQASPKKTTKPKTTKVQKTAIIPEFSAQ